MNSKAVANVIALRIFLTGLVQGIGMRPAIARLAERFSLNGFVQNDNQGVEILIQGCEKNIAQFRENLRNSLPSATQINSIHFEGADAGEFSSFKVIEQTYSNSTTELTLDESNSLAAQVPTDRVICQSCLEEMGDPLNSRFHYPFISCTDCGPRFSIIDKMPFERANTSMVGFQLCRACQQENATGSDRRFHCQTNACPECGPGIWIRNAQDESLASGNDAIEFTAREILRNRIVAMRGIGGYQLLCDATSNDAVLELRLRKKRDRKPFAILVGSLHQAMTIADLDKKEQEVLTSEAGPVLIAAGRSDNTLAHAVSSGFTTIGLHAPYNCIALVCLERCRKTTSLHKCESKWATACVSTGRFDRSTKGFGRLLAGTRSPDYQTHRR